MNHRKRLTIDVYDVGWRVAGLAEAPDADGLLAHLDNVGVSRPRTRGFTALEATHRKQLTINVYDVNSRLPARPRTGREHV